MTKVIKNVIIHPERKDIMSRRDIVITIGTIFAIISMMAMMVVQEKTTLASLSEEEGATLIALRHELRSLTPGDLVSVEEGPKMDGLVVVEESVIRTYIVSQIDPLGGAFLSYHQHRPENRAHWIRFGSLDQTQRLQKKVTSIVRKRDNPEGWYTLATWFFTA